MTCAARSPRGAVVVSEGAGAVEVGGRDWGARLGAGWVRVGGVVGADRDVGEAPVAGRADGLPDGLAEGLAEEDAEVDGDADGESVVGSSMMVIGSPIDPPLRPPAVVCSGLGSSAVAREISGTASVPRPRTTSVQAAWNASRRRGLVSGRRCRPTSRRLSSTGRS